MSVAFAGSSTAAKVDSTRTSRSIIIKVDSAAGMERNVVAMDMDMDSVEK